MVSGAIPQSVAGSDPVQSTVANAVATAPASTERLPGSTDARRPLADAPDGAIRYTAPTQSTTYSSPSRSSPNDEMTNGVARSTRMAPSSSRKISPEQKSPNT